MTDNVQRYPFLLSFLEQAEDQLTEEQWKSLVQDLERFKLDVGVTFLKDFINTCKDGDVPLDSVVGHLDEAIEGMYKDKGIEPPNHESL